MEGNLASEATALNHRQSVQEEIEPEAAAVSSRQLLRSFFFKFNKTKIRFMICGLIILLFLSVVIAAFSLGRLKIVSGSPLLSVPDITIQSATGETNNLQAETVCYSERCNETGLLTTASINNSAEPCHDFEEYACGGWRKDFGPTVESQFSSRQAEVVRKVQGILGHPVTETDGVPLRLAKSFYNQCTDLPSMEKVGKGLILELLDDYGGWPSLEGPSWKPEYFSLPKSIGFASRFLRFAPLIAISLTVDLKGPNSMVIVIKGPDTLLDQEWYWQSSEARANQIWVLMFKYVRLAERLSENTLAAYGEDAINLAYFEERLVNAAAPENATNKFYDSLGDLIQDVYGGTQNESASQALLDEVTWSVAADVVENRTALPVKVQNINYFKQLAKIIDSTPTRVLANYLSYIVAGLLREETLKYPQFSQLSKSAQATALQHRRTYCQQEALTAFEMPIGAEYMKQNSHETPYQRDLELMALNIKAMFHETLVRATWLSETLRHFLVNKLEAMTIHIGYPHWILNETLLLDEYNGLSVGPTYFDTLLNVNSWLTDKRNRGCHSRDAWSLPCEIYSKAQSKTEGKTRASSPLSTQLPAFDKLDLFSVNAWHNRIKNTIVIPAGIIGSPLYDKDEQMLIKYARIGVSIAHEIAHGMDDLGMVVAADGAIIDDHVTEGDRVEVEQKLRCLTEQYSEFHSKLGTSTLRRNNKRENTADNIALIMAYRAYQNWIESENAGKPEPKLPHLEYSTPNQLFFLIYAMTWCETEEEAANADYHGPGNLRANVPLQNSPEFAQAWNCGLGTRMNPKRKCMDL